MSLKVIVTRDVPASENYSGRAVGEGEILHVYNGATYGCIRDGIALSQDGGTPFFEFPRDAVDFITDDWSVPA